MGIGLALLGIAIGAAGVEVLRAKNPGLIDKVEGAARGFVEKMSPKSADTNTENTTEEETNNEDEIKD